MDNDRKIRFSVLLPTRNGGKYLGDCIKSILDELYEDMELIVSNNANTDETVSVLKSFLTDRRLKVLNLSDPVSVTDNWNHALSASRGEYILMMGDDDCLLPGYFKRIEEILNRYDDPDCVTYNAYSYLAPYSVGEDARSYYKDPFFDFGRDFTGEGLIPAEKRFSIVRDMFRFHNRIPLNMQATLMSRKAIGRISGGIFRPPFPDHYALNSLMLISETWAYVPEKLLVVGVSPKSFGHFVYSNKQDEGVKYLGVDARFKGRLPGSEMNNCMMEWLFLLKANYGELLSDVNISRASYVRRQIYAWYTQYRAGAVPFRHLVERFGMLSFIDWLYLASVFTEKKSWQRLGSIFKTGKNSLIRNIWQGAMPLEDISTIKEFASWISRPSDAAGERP